MSKVNNVMLFCLSLITYYWLLTSVVLASDYALPYPSYMPGNRLYTISEWWDRLMEYWNFGDIAGIKYERAMSDKYLVEAETLFSYGQYKLAVDALNKSDVHFTNAVIHLFDITGNHKDDGSQKKLLQDQANKHLEIIEKFDDTLPDTITWQSEKSEPEDLGLSILFSMSRTTRKYANR